MEEQVKEEKKSFNLKIREAIKEASRIKKKHGISMEEQWEALGLKKTSFLNLKKKKSNDISSYHLAICCKYYNIDVNILIKSLD